MQGSESDFVIFEFWWGSRVYTWTLDL